MSVQRVCKRRKKVSKKAKVSYLTGGVLATPNAKQDVVTLAVEEKRREEKRNKVYV